MSTTTEAEGVLAVRVFPRLYRDSVALMALASGLEQLPGVVRVGAVMATPSNVEILGRAAMCPPDLAAAPDDLLVSVRAIDDPTASAALDTAEAGLTATDTGPTGSAVRAAPGTLREAFAEQPEANLVAVSTPGTYAPIVAEQALRTGRHVFCFSDTVSVPDEIRLKELAAESGLVLMGPDCGTALLDGVPLGFANVVRPGPVTIVSASGTGAQEVACLLHRAGVGVRQIVGVGGRDLSAEVGGLMTLHVLDLVDADPETEVVVVVSKPPAAAVAEALLARLATMRAPTVACLLGQRDTDEPVPVRGTLEGGARAAAALAGADLELADPEQSPEFRGLVAEGPRGPGVRGLFVGGTLASEARYVLRELGVDAEVLDLGDDQYTAGRPHPMIDPTLRADEIARTGQLADVGVLLVDVVLGYGSAADPAGPVADAVRAARAEAADAGRALVVVGSVCGTDADPQDLAAQQRALAEAGILLAPSAAAAARLAGTLAGGHAPASGSGAATSERSGR